MTIIAFNRHWVVRWHWLLVNLLVVAILLFLSAWQWQRAAQKQQSLQLLAQWQTQKAFSLSELIAGSIADRTSYSTATNSTTTNNPDSLSNDARLLLRDGAAVNFSARWLAPYVWLLDNQIVKGRPGYDVLIPVQENDIDKKIKNKPTNNTTTKNPVVLINLGWVAAPAQRSELPVVQIPAEFIVQGIYRAQASNFLLGKNLEDAGRWPMRIQQPEHTLLANYLPAPLITGVIYQQHESPFALHYHPVVLPPERHKAYALQWLLLAIAALLIGLACAKGSETAHFMEKAL